MTSLLACASLAGCSAKDIKIPNRIAGYALDQDAREVFAAHIAHTSRKFRDVAGYLFARVNEGDRREIDYNEARRVIDLMAQEEDNFYASLIEKYGPDTRPVESGLVAGTK